MWRLLLRSAKNLEPDCRAALVLLLQCCRERKGGRVPLLRYFVVVAGALLAMLAFVDWFFPSPPPMPGNESSVDRSTLRIQSERKWPQKVEFDTAMQPFIAPTAPAAATAVDAMAAVRPEKRPLDALAKAQLSEKASEPQVAKPKPRVRVARRTPRSAPRDVAAASPAAPTWPFGWGEPVAGSARQSLDTHTSARSGMFGEGSRQNIVSWSSGGASDW
jgi:hypothetical protein